MCIACTRALTCTIRVVHKLRLPKTIVIKIGEIIAVCVYV